MITLRNGTSLTSFLLTSLLLTSCGNGGATEDHEIATSGDEITEQAESVPLESAPPSGTPRDVSFPVIAASATTSGLSTNIVQFGQLPIVYLRLVIRSGSADDPTNLPGLAHLVAEMLKEGTRARTSAQLAEATEFLGAELTVGADEENVYIMVRALAEHLDQAMEILADVARNPRFAQGELDRLEGRERERLALSSRQPRYLARRTFYERLYGNHPYARTDVTEATLTNVARTDLTRFHTTHFVPNNALLVAVGGIDSARVQEAVERHFRGWRSHEVPETQYAEPPTRTTRQVIVIDRPESVQSMIYVGNLALARNSEDFVPLEVANQVLGGSAASRLFMDLREQRSLTYGAYSAVSQRPQIAPFSAYASVRNEVTAEAMAGFMEHLERIVREPLPEAEVENARRFLSDSFPLEIETASRVAMMVEELRVFGLADDYWDTYRTSINNVTAPAASAAARQYIQPQHALIVAVGRATDIVEPLRRYGPVEVIDHNGNAVAQFEALSN